jgi:hypothetical protein
VKAQDRPDVNQGIDRGVIRAYWELWQQVEQVNESMEGWSMTGMIITEIRVRGPELTGGGFMAVIKGIDEARHPFVAFRSAATVRELFGKVGGDLIQGTLAMKEEQPYDPGKSKATKA